MEFRIENVPLPESRLNSLSQTLRALNVGQSFLIPTDKLKKNTHKGIFTIARNVGVAITTRKVDEGLRVWRKDANVQNEAEIVEDEVPMTRAEKLDNLREMMANPQVFKSPEPTIEEWIDIGEKWNEITGEMVEMQRHYKNPNKFREKPL